MGRLTDWWHSKQVILMDGAMGTQLMQAGLQPGECCEVWNLTHSDQVRAVHQAYVDAGAECLLTNTFQAHPKSLARHGLADRAEEIIQAGIQLARNAAGPARAVLAAFGPAGDDWDQTSWRQMMRAIKDVDGLLLETFSDLQGLWIAKYVCLPLCADLGIPVLLSMTYRRAQDGTLTSQSGHSPEVFARLAGQYGVQALGVNCGREIGRADMIAILRRYREATELPLFVRPNAGTPMQEATGWRYPVTAHEMASWVAELLEAGAAMFGGCCGTTPAHIRKMGEARRVREKARIMKD